MQAAPDSTDSVAGVSRCSRASACVGGYAWQRAVRALAVYALVVFASSVLALGADDNLGQWRQASPLSRLSLSAAMLRRVTKDLPEGDLESRAVRLRKCVDMCGRRRPRLHEGR